MNIVEIIAVVFSLLCVILTVRNNIWCWPVGIIGIIFYAILFYQNQIWGNMTLQGIMIIQSLFGWYNWNKPSKYPIKWLIPYDRTTFICFTGLSSILIYCITSGLGDIMPIFDGITTSLSISAMILLSYRKIDNWIYWIIADIIFICFFYINHLYLSVGIYFIFLLLSISGLLKWSRNKLINK